MRPQNRDAGPVTVPALEPTSAPIGIPDPFTQPMLEDAPEPRPTFEPVADSDIEGGGEERGTNNTQTDDVQGNSNQANKASSSRNSSICAIGATQDSLGAEPPGRVATSLLPI